MEGEILHSIEFKDPMIGRVLQDRYRVIRPLGRGGMGVVYLVEHILIRRKLALKLLHSQLAASEELVHRFHREARAAAGVGNEHIVDVTDMGRLDDGTYYIVLEYLDGLDLAALVAQSGPLPVARVVDIGIQICEALADVHAQGIVHRDLKPENIVLIKRGRSSDFVKILDFGICKVSSEQPLTATGIALGTPHFMAPEQLEARPEVDARADIYGVGAILYYALSGRTPFTTESLPRLLVDIWSQPAPKLRSVRPDAPAALEALIAHTLEKLPAQRLPDSRTLATSLAALAESTDRTWALHSGVREVTPPPELAPAPQARPWLKRMVTSLATVLGAALFLGWIYLLGSSVVGSSRKSESQTIAPTPIRAVERPEGERSPEPQPAQAVAPQQPRPEAAVPAIRPPVRRKKVSPLQPSSATEPAPEALEAPRTEPVAEPPAPARARDALIVPDPAELRRVF